MKKILQFALLLALASVPCWAAVSHVTTTGNSGACNDTTKSGNYTGTCASNGKVGTFTFTPTTTGDQIIIMVTCAAGSATPSAVTLTATGWTITQQGTIGGSTTAGFSSVFTAYAPSTSLATFTDTWTVATNGCGAGSSQFISDLIDEWTGGDATNFVDAKSAAAVATGTTGGCSVSVTPVASNDGIWVGCYDSVTAATSPYAKGSDDTFQDWTEWKVISGTGTQTSAFTTTGAFTNFAIAIKPAGGAAVRTMPPAVF